MWGNYLGHPIGPTSINTSITTKDGNMETQAFNDLIMSDDLVLAQRAKASAELNEIARITKQALVKAGIDLDLFFMVPSSGNAILTYGTAGDPDDNLWDRVRDIVVPVLQEIIGLERPQCRAVLCATTGPIANSGNTTITQVESAVQ
jgi:hypothetical protein